MKQMELSSLLKQDAAIIIKEALARVQPDRAVAAAMAQLKPGSGRVVLVAIGKAAWQMAKAAVEVGSPRIDQGIVITKYGHSKGSLGSLRIFEAGHPVPDANSFAATEAVLELVQDLGAEDRVLFLVSGGGSALFEKPLLPADQLQSITEQLLACGATITETNTIRKRLSAVKGGKLALACAPAKVFAIVLSDIVGDPLDMIASGPAYPDSSTAEEAVELAVKYGLELSEQAWTLLHEETPKELYNVEIHITGSVKELCLSAEETCARLGYRPIFLTASLTGEAKEVGSLLAAIARDHQNTKIPLAYICGGETIVHLQGKGKGGRNQELALSAALGMEGLKGAALFSLGSDGTDGPTDAAGGYVDGNTLAALKQLGVEPSRELADNNAYPTLKRVEGLIRTGPTGTNVNDLTVLLLRP